MNTLLHNLSNQDQSKPPLNQKIEAKELIFGALNPNTHVSQAKANASN